MIRNWILAVAFALLAGGGFLTVASPQTVVAAPMPDTCNSGFLGFPSWYRGLTKDDGNGNPCALKSPGEFNSPPNATNPNPNDGLAKFIWLIGLNIVEIVLVAIAYIASGFFLFGGFLFIKSRGNPEGAARARQTLLNAIIGLIISLAAIAIINFVTKAVIQ